MSAHDPRHCALLLVDMQNDFLHPDGAYARAGVGSPQLDRLTDRLAPVAEALRRSGAWVVSTHFTLVPGKHGQPFISSHLRALRPFLATGDFAPGRFGHRLVDALQPVDMEVEKISFSAFYMSRLEWVLGRAEVRHLIVGGIVTNGGVASTVRDAHVRDFDVTVLSDGCAAFDPAVHTANIEALVSVARVATCAEVMAEFQ